MRRSLKLSVAVAFLVLNLNWVITAELSAQTAYPMVMSISPVSAQVGQTSPCTIRSRYSMEGAYQIIVSGAGVRGEVVIAEEPAKEASSSTQADEKKKAASIEALKVKFHVDKDALPGVRDVRVATPRGVSTVGQLVIVTDPVASETEGNDTQATAQQISLPATVCGRIDKAEDVDFYRFKIDQPTRLNFHVQCMRLEDRVHDLQTHADPILFIRDASGAVVASADNSFSADPLVSTTLERAGEYFVELRDVRYQGNTYWEYSIEINSRPLVTCVYPLGVAAQADTAVELIGYGLDAGQRASITAAQLAQPGMLPVGLNVADSLLRPVTMVACEKPTILEDDRPNNEPVQAQMIDVRAGINGRIESAADVDCYQFQARRGERYSFEVIARRAGSALDSHLRLLDAKGNQLQLSDDMRLGKRNYPDSWIENWTVPSDGQYTLEIRDLHLRGGADFVYFLQISPATPQFLLYTDTDKTPIAAGTTGVLYVRAERKNGFEGPIQLRVHGLPEGVTAHAGRILPGKATDGCIVFEAPATLPPQIARITIDGSATVAESDGKMNEIVDMSTIYQEIYQPGGGRGHWPVDSHVLALCSPGDLRAVRVSQEAIRLKPGQKATVEVELERAPGFDKNVTLEVNYSHLAQIFGNSLPEGVTIDASASNTLLTGGASKGKIVFKAADNAAAVDRQQFVVMANVSLNFVMKATYASRPIFITVEDPTATVGSNIKRVSTDAK